MVQHLSQFIEAILPVILGAGITLAVLAWVSPYMQALVRHVFAKVAEALHHLADGLEPPTAALAAGVGTVRLDLTNRGTTSLTKAVIVVLVLLPLMMVLASVDLMMWSQFFSVQSPEPIELPGLGEISAGQFRALLPVTAALLDGYLVEGALGWIPMPFTRPDLPPAVLRRTRAVLLVVAFALWAVLVANAIDMGAAIYAELGRNHCAQVAVDQVSGDTVTDPSLDAFGTTQDEGSGRLSSSDSSTSMTPAYSTCFTEWQADSVGESMQVVQAELALNLVGIFGFVAFQFWSLVALVIIVMGIVTLRLVRFVIRFAAWAMLPIGELVERVLQIPTCLFQLILRVLPRHSMRPTDGPDAPRPGTSRVGLIRRLVQRRAPPSAIVTFRSRHSRNGSSNAHHENSVEHSVQPDQLMETRQGQSESET